jgi:hypothetical protein
MSRTRGSTCRRFRHEAVDGLSWASVGHRRARGERARAAYREVLPAMRARADPAGRRVCGAMLTRLLAVGPPSSVPIRRTGERQDFCWPVLEAPLWRRHGPGSGSAPSGLAGEVEVA